MFNNILDKMDKFIGVLAFFGINGFIIKKYLNEITVFLKTYYIEIIIIQIVLLILLIVFIYILYRKIKHSNTVIKVNYNDILNKKIFEKFLEDRKSLFSQKINQLIKKGYIKLYGKEVKEIQISLIDYMNEVEDKIIRTVDLTTNPTLWLTRKEYINKNKKFIENGGKIYRILVVDVKKFDETIFRDNLIKLCDEFLKIGVDLKLCILEKLTSEEAEDFIMYDSFAVLIEDKQADEEYKVASSTLFFDKTTFESVNKKFKKVDTKSILINSKERCREFIKKKGNL